MGVIIDGQEISKNIQDTIKTNVKGYMIRPSVAVIQIGENKENDSYIAIKEKVCSSVGIYFRLYKFEEGTPELTIINKIKELNNDDYVNGIMIHLPIPARYSEKRLINTISNAKDVDGLTDINVGRYINGKKTLVPCTALAVMRILEESNIELEGKHVVIVGRSKLVGRPLVNAFLQKDATVTVTHSKTQNLGDITSLADVLVVAAGVPKLIKDNMVKKDAVVIDVGVNDVDGKLVGDVDFDKVSKKTSYITKVPGGVGPVTVAMLLENILVCYNSKNSKK